MGRRDTARYMVSSIYHDLRCALREGQAFRLVGEIFRYRVAQYLGSYSGNHEHRRLSHAEKDIYFYPSERSETL